MDEHRIRLRGGWECGRIGTAGSAPERMTLPVRWAPEISGRMRLSRRFGRPHLDAARQILLLELDRVQGMQTLLLNGEILAAASPARSSYEIPLGELLERNLLVLEVETGGAGGDSVGQDPGLGAYRGSSSGRSETAGPRAGGRAAFARAEWVASGNPTLGVPTPRRIK